MGLSASQRQRLQEIAGEVREIVGRCMHSDGRPMTFAELEKECVEAGDFLTAAVLQERIIQRPPESKSACCPTCDRPGERRTEDEPRVLHTDRGEVSWLEPIYDCRKWEKPGKSSSKPNK